MYPWNLQTVLFITGLIFITTLPFVACTEGTGIQEAQVQQAEEFSPREMTSFEVVDSLVRNDLLHPDQVVDVIERARNGETADVIADSLGLPRGVVLHIVQAEKELRDGTDNERNSHGAEGTAVVDTVARE